MSEDALTIDNYELVNCVATGNSTQVWEVKEQGGTQSYAMKLLLPESLKDLNQVRILKAETKAGKTFDHPNLVKVYFSSINKKRGYMVMDFFRAPNLSSQIHGNLASVQIRIRKLIESASLALGHIHEKGWVHRDIKPDNILFNKGGELRIIDFSLSARNKRKHKEIQGTKSYIAPETLLRKAVTGQTDMYSFGVTIYLVLTGDLPITGVSPQDLLKNHILQTPPPPSAINPNVTPEMDAFVMKMMAKKPADRYKTMAEVYAEFRNIKVFHEEIEVIEARRRKEEEQSLLDGVDAAIRLDSRADAERSKLKGDSPSPKKIQSPPQPKPKATTLPSPQPQTQSQPQPSPSAPPQVPPQGMPPQQAPMYNPAMQQPMYPQQPGMMPMYGYAPGQPVPPGMMPGQSLPGMPPNFTPPGYPPQTPQQGGQPPMPATPVAQPQAGQPVTQPQSPPTTPAPSQPSRENSKPPATTPDPEPSKDDELDFMQDLPEVV